MINSMHPPLPLNHQYLHVDNNYSKPFQGFYITSLNLIVSSDRTSRNLKHRGIEVATIAEGHSLEQRKLGILL